MGNYFGFLFSEGFDDKQFAFSQLMTDFFPGSLFLRIIPLLKLFHGREFNHNHTIELRTAFNDFRVTSADQVAATVPAHG